MLFYSFLKNKITIKIFKKYKKGLIFNHVIELKRQNNHINNIFSEMARIELATSILKTDILPIKLHLRKIIPCTGFEPVTHR